MKVILGLLVLISIPFLKLRGQSEFILKLDPAIIEDTSKMKDLYQFYPGAKIKRISPFANFFLIAPNFKYQSFLNYAITNALIPQEKIVQYGFPNYTLKPRTSAQNVPDDANLLDQWYLEKTQTYKAWEITTGGLLQSGDTLVTAVFEGGFNISHPEISVQSIWKNKDEVPLNRQDDDGNSYEDDYLGLSFYDNAEILNYHVSDTPSDNQHGNAVLGVIGAKTDNSSMISGMIWNPKFLLVSGTRMTTSEWLEGMYYIMNQRKLYNESNGAIGTLVVANNMSWGTDYTKLKDGNFAFKSAFTSALNDLGAQGILTIGATDNVGNKNMDLKFNGQLVHLDLPTQSESPFLIMVTNTDELDEKVNGAGFGKTSVDLGAPGKNFIQLDEDNGLIWGSGTSFSTPQVTAAIQLMYSVPIEGIKEKILREPSYTALNIKAMLLQSVDPVPSLAGITTTGGRLNVHAAVSSALDYFAASTDPNPGNLILSVHQLESYLQIILVDSVNEGYWEIYDTSGKSLGKGYLDDSIFELHIGHLASGIHFLHIDTPEGNQQMKFFKIK